MKPLFFGSDRLAGRFVGPIAQSGPFWAQKRCFLAWNQFFVASLNKIVTIMTGHLKDNLFCWLDCRVVSG